MSDVVWISTAPGHASNQRPLRHSFSETEKRQYGIDCGRRNDTGESLDSECFPSEIYGAPNAKESNYKLPNLFFAGSYWAVTKEAADVLRQFDLGGGALYPVRLFKKDRVTPIEGEFFCINFGNRKEAFLPDHSTSFREEYIRDGNKGWFSKATMKDDDFSVSRLALDGSDVWIDYNVGDSFFISDRLRSAFKKAKCDKGFFLNRCLVVSIPGTSIPGT